ncbi:Pre-mRNA splicing, partial [Coemansia nantahalensis]
AHFSRLVLPADLAADQAWVLARALPLLQAMVDVAASVGWLAPALAAMELSQMAVQAVWEGRDPLVKQVPHLALQTARDMRVDSVFDIMDMEDADRARLLAGLSPPQVAEVAAYVNRYPSIEAEHVVEGGVTAGAEVAVALSMSREVDDDDDDGGAPGPVIAPFFPYSKSEGWWAVVGDPQTQTLLVVKRIAVGRSLTTRLVFAAPETPGPRKFKLYLMCDAYLGCDQELDVDVDVQPAADESDGE